MTRGSDEKNQGSGNTTNVRLFSKWVTSVSSVDQNCSPAEPRHLGSRASKLARPAQPDTGPTASVPSPVTPGTRSTAPLRAPPPPESRGGASRRPWHRPGQPWTLRAAALALRGCVQITVQRGGTHIHQRRTVAARPARGAESATAARGAGATAGGSAARVGGGGDSGVVTLGERVVRLTSCGRKGEAD